MPLTTAEHQQAQRQRKDARNAAARRRRATDRWARQWCDAMQATIERTPYADGWLYCVRVTGFHPAYGRELWWAVATLDDNIEAFCDSQATFGPTKGSLAPVRVRWAAWQAAQGKEDMADGHS